MSDEAREAAWDAALDGNFAAVFARRELFDAGFDAGVAEGIRQARQAVANVDPIDSALMGTDAALEAIDALGEADRG